MKNERIERTFSYFHFHFKFLITHNSKLITSTTLGTLNTLGTLGTQQHNSSTPQLLHYLTPPLLNSSTT
jgi:hypothetical protein